MRVSYVSFLSIVSFFSIALQGCHEQGEPDRSNASPNPVIGTFVDGKLVWSQTNTVINTGLVSLKTLIPAVKPKIADRVDLTDDGKGMVYFGDSDTGYSATYSHNVADEPDELQFCEADEMTGETRYYDVEITTDLNNGEKLKQKLLFSISKGTCGGTEVACVFVEQSHAEDGPEFDALYEMTEGGCSTNEMLVDSDEE